MGRRSIDLSHREYLAVTLPFMLSTVTQPLLGAVDTAVIGMMGEAAAIAGVSLGANLFNTLYWLFGFLRVSTTGRSAQLGEGAGNKGAAFIFPCCSLFPLPPFFWRCGNRWRPDICG